MIEWKYFKNPITLAGVAFLAAGLVFSQFLLVALGMTAVVGGLLHQSFRQAAKADSKEALDLHPEDRVLLRPFTHMRDDLKKTIENNREHSGVQVVGMEALAEAEELIVRVHNLIVHRRNLRRTLTRRAETEKSINNLNNRLGKATSQSERDSLEAAIAARTTEKEQYGKVEETIARIDSKISQSEAAMAELQARLAVGATNLAQGSADQGALDDLTNRLKTLATSFEEAEEAIMEESI